MSAAGEAPGAAGPPDRQRRRLLRAGAALPLLASCRGPEPDMPRHWERFAQADGQGYAAVVVRRLAVRGCKDLFRPAFRYVRREDAPEDDGTRARLVVRPPDTGDWSPDPGRPSFIRTSYLLQLPAGSYSIVGAHRYYDLEFQRDHPSGRLSSISREGFSQTLPLRFDVLPGRAVYIGGLGVRPTFVEGGLRRMGGFRRGCEAEDGSHFFHADAGSDIPFLRARHPALAGFEVLDKSAAPPGWDGLPAGG